ncbi:hypothetical protein PV04_02812 [Phialophora macrospora]|uniref:DUF202 domain-containing protein n=1 Tax=Phialophora macrospora TaxID=1851006 RepID=A0A0D2GEI3_9EURO|nr:hypothetical protein PV04_02812 [Phialophora macrospora]
MRDAHNTPSNPTDRSRQVNEEYELDGLGNTANQPAVAPLTTSTPTRSPVEGRSTARHAFRKWIAHPPHIHYVPMKAARDHLANERVFLAYIRTSSALANFAVAILQLYRLQHNPLPRGKLTDYDLGIPLATVTLILAIAVTVAGVWRFFTCQNDMALRNQIVTSGAVVLVFTPVFILLLLTFFIFTIVVNPDLGA